MTTQEIATKLAAHCRKGEFEAAQRELYATNAVSTEPEASPAFEKVTKGLDAIIEKGRKFGTMIEKVNSFHVSEPLVAGNSIAFTLRMDVVMKGRGKTDMSEICLYQVKDGKIVSEEFHM